MLEADASMQKAKQKGEDMPKAKYRVKLLSTFLQISDCCTNSIVGCYAPDGDHAEKPLENAIKANCAFASLSEDKPEAQEMENLEVFFFYYSYVNMYSCYIQTKEFLCIRYIQTVYRVFFYSKILRPPI